MIGNSKETRWSLVVRARGDTPEARAALSELCEIYYAPVHAFIKRWARPEDARDLTHEFFARVLEKDSLEAADPKRGKFRSYLFSAARHFLQDTNAKANCQKRGGNCQHIALDKISVSDPGALPPDVEFDRIWACALVDRCLSRLSEEMEEKGKRRTFEILRPWLAGAANHGDQVEVADKLEISETAVRVLVHRMRKRLREIVEAEVAQTLEPGADVVAELRQILGAW